jgi:hypothetical protein
MRMEKYKRSSILALNLFCLEVNGEVNGKVNARCIGIVTPKEQARLTLVQLYVNTPTPEPRTSAQK